MCVVSAKRILFQMRLKQDAGEDVIFNFVMFEWGSQHWSGERCYDSEHDQAKRVLFWK